MHCNFLYLFLTQGTRRKDLNGNGSHCQARVTKSAGASKKAEVSSGGRHPGSSKQSDAVWWVTRLQKSLNKLCKPRPRAIHFNRGDQSNVKIKCQKMGKERLSCEPAQQSVWYFWPVTSSGCWCVRNLIISESFPQPVIEAAELVSPATIPLFTKAPVKHSSRGALNEWINHQISGSLSPWEVSVGIRSSITHLLRVI